MDYSAYDKRISPRVYPWWLILVGFVFGVIATLIFTGGRTQPSVDYYPGYDGNVWMEGQPAPGEMGRNVYIAPESEIDTFMATATAIVAQATAQAALPNTAPEIDLHLQMATDMVAQATLTAQPNG